MALREDILSVSILESFLQLAEGPLQSYFLHMFEAYSGMRAFAVATSACPGSGCPGAGWFGPILARPLAGCDCTYLINTRINIGIHVSTNRGQSLGFEVHVPHVQLVLAELRDHDLEFNHQVATRSVLLDQTFICDDLAGLGGDYCSLQANGDFTTI